jgi:hypothetical protein
MMVFQSSPTQTLLAPMLKKQQGQSAVVLDQEAPILFNGKIFYYSMERIVNTYVMRLQHWLDDSAIRLLNGLIFVAFSQID